MDATEKMVIIVTHGPEAPEMATLPFVMAASALVSDVEVFVACQAEGTQLVCSGGAEGVQAPGFPPLTELIDTIREFGGTIVGCSPCLESRGICAEDLLDGVEIIGAARLVSEITSATSTLTY